MIRTIGLARRLASGLQGTETLRFRLAKQSEPALPSVGHWRIGDTVMAPQRALRLRAGDPMRCDDRQFEKHEYDVRSGGAGGRAGRAPTR